VRGVKLCVFISGIANVIVVVVICERYKRIVIEGEKGSGVSIVNESTLVITGSKQYRTTTKVLLRPPHEAAGIKLSITVHAESERNQSINQSIHAWQRHTPEQRTGNKRSLHVRVRFRTRRTAHCV
jgi:hypothetical protein